MTMGATASVLDTLGAVTLLAWTVAMWAAVAVLAYANRGPVRPWVYRTAAAQIFLGVVGQLGHLQEHIAQVGYWVVNPNAPAWMTPWGTGLADGFGQIDHSKPSLGMEILHFAGNLLFLAGIVGVMLITQRAVRSKARTWAKMGVWMQGIHGLEHFVLMLTVWLGAPRAIGMSTWFGLLEPGPGLWTYRVWWHFAANVVGSVVFAIAVYHLWRERGRIASAYQPASTTGNEPHTNQRSPVASRNSEVPPSRSAETPAPTGAAQR
ncbi:DUF6008 family protein [Amycolatopsis palatopharyngis]|uniref:DUF6008 family protein n=1 Tax=Amycolatopsis palatopharyngis TaxID=187982 RepID=UPI001FEC46CE|nr:DUF6008 family protein [Amycolatopsis palatopharyngis]